MSVRVLFVCTGNTCRSPMAEGLLRRLAAARGLVLEVVSAGTGAVDGVPACEHAVTALGERGIDLSRHRSRALTAELVHWADLVLTMTRRHGDYVRQLAPEAADRVFTLGEYAGDPVEIPDPWGGGVESYRDTADTLGGLLEQIVEQLPRQGEEH